MLDDKIAEYMDVLAKSTMTTGPQVLHLVIQHEHWCGMDDLCIGFVSLVLFLVLAYVVKRNWARCSADACGAWICIPVIGICIAFLVACVTLLDIWNWVAVFNPKMALFHDILTKFLSK